VLALDANTGAVLRRIPVGRGATSLAASSDTLFVGNATDKTVTAVPLTRHVPTTTFHVDVAPSGLSVSRDELFITSVLGGAAERLNLATHRSLGTADVPYANGVIAVEGTRVVLATYGPDNALVTLDASGTAGLRWLTSTPSRAQFQFLGTTKGDRIVGLPINTGTYTYL
jgi:hypothetical protein